MTESKASLAKRVAALEKDYLRADAAACRAVEVLRAASERLSQGNDGAAFNLMDAAIVVLENYEGGS